MLKYMIKKGYVDFNKIILENYAKLNITEQELVVVITLVELYKLNKLTFTTSSITKKTNLSNDTCSACLNSLLNKGLISLEIEYINKKAKEIFNVNDLFNKLEKLFNEEVKVETIATNEVKIKEIIDLLEQSFNKALTPYELEIVLEWSSANIQFDLIKNAIDIALTKNIMNLRYIDKIILSNNSYNETIDENDSKVLDDIFRSLK